MSADIIQNSAVGNFPLKQKKQRQKQLGADKLVTTQIWKLKNWMSLATLKSKSIKLLTFLKSMHRLKQEWQKSPAGPGKQAAKTWFGLVK